MGVGLMTMVAIGDRSSLLLMISSLDAVEARSQIAKLVCHVLYARHARCWDGFSRSRGVDLMIMGVGDSSSLVCNMTRLLDTANARSQPAEFLPHVLGAGGGGVVEYEIVVDVGLTTVSIGLELMLDGLVVLVLKVLLDSGLGFIKVMVWSGTNVIIFKLDSSIVDFDIGLDLESVTVCGRGMRRSVRQGPIGASFWKLDTVV
jgi:hypothetical protein